MGRELVNRSNQQPASATFNFGSRLPLAVDCGVYLLIGMGMWLIAQELTKVMGHVAAFALYLSVCSVTIVLWAFAWRQRVTLTSEGLIVSRALRWGGRLIRYDELLSVVANPPNMLEVELLSGEKVLLVRIRGNKSSPELGELSQGVSTRCRLRPHAK